MSRMNRSRRVQVLAIGAVLACGLVGVAAGQDAEAPADTTVSVSMAIGSGLDRESKTLSGEGDVFAADGGTVYCLTRVVGMVPPAVVTHAWYHEGKTMARVDLDVGSTSWRTWSSKNYLPSWTGAWEVKILDENGKVLETAGFTVE